MGAAEAQAVGAATGQGAQTATAVAAVITAIRALRGEDPTRWIVDAVRPDARPETSEEELRRAAEQEMGREVEFLRRMQERLVRDMNTALVGPDPGAAIDVILKREKGFLAMHEEAAATRAAEAARRVTLKRLSPAGAYWIMSPHVKAHTPDCVAMSAVGWWPWDILDLLHPPMHPGCRCALLTHGEARERGLMGEAIPDATGAAQRAQQIADAYGLLQEAEDASPRGSSLVRTPHGQSGFEVLELAGLGGEHAALDLEEVAWNRRYAEGTVWGGRFMPRRGGFAPRISLGDVLRRLMGADAPNLVGRGGQRSPATAAAPAASAASSTPDLPQTEGTPGVVAGVSGPTTTTGRPRSFDEMAQAVQEEARRIGEANNATVSLKSVTVNPDRPDTEGWRTYDGHVEIGIEGQANIERANAMLENHQRIDDDTASGVYAAYRTMAHEAVGHSVNPMDGETYEDPASYALEESLTEEAATALAVDMLKRHGHHDVLRWFRRNPDDLRARGMYLPQRGGLLAIMDEAKVPLGERESLIRHLAFGVDPKKRQTLLGELIAGPDGDVDDSRGRVQALMADLAELDPRAQGASVLRPANFTDHRMRIRRGATVSVGNREVPYEGRVLDAGYGEDGRWYAEVEVKLEDGLTTYRYPDPDDVEHLKDPPKHRLKGENISGVVAEGDAVRIKELNGDILIGELRKVEGEDALGWKAEVLTDDAKVVMVRASSINDMTRAKAGAESRKRPLSAPGAGGDEDTPEAPEPPESAPGGAQTPPEGIDATPQDLEDVDGPDAFDARRYSDPRRSLIRKVRARKPGEMVTAADGTQFIRGGAVDSVLVKRPDGSRRRYATANRMANAETPALLGRHGIKGGMESPSERILNYVLDGKRRFEADRKNPEITEDMAPASLTAATKLHQGHRRGAQSWQSVIYDEIQTLLRDPDGWRDFHASKVAAKETPLKYSFQATDNRWVNGTVDDPGAMAEQARHAYWFNDAIETHGRVPESALYRLTGMDHLDADARRRLDAGEEVTLVEPGFLATTGKLDVATRIATQGSKAAGPTAKGELALWEINANGQRGFDVEAAALMGGKDNGEWVFPSGMSYTLQRIDGDGERLRYRAMLQERVQEPDGSRLASSSGTRGERPLEDDVHGVGMASPAIHLTRQSSTNPALARMGAASGAGPMPLSVRKGDLERPSPTGFGRRSLTPEDRKGIERLDFYPGEPDASAITLSDGSVVTASRHGAATRYSVKREVGSVDNLESPEEVVTAISALRDEEETRALETIRDWDKQGETEMALAAADALTSVMFKPLGMASPPEYTPEQHEATLMYLRGANARIGKELRAGELSEPSKPIVKGLDEAIAASPPAPPTLYRAVMLKNLPDDVRATIESASPGDSWTEKGYTSTTKDPDLAKSLDPGGTGDKSRVLLEITGTEYWRGLDMERAEPDNPYALQEKEVLLPRDGTFRVDEVGEGEIDGEAVKRLVVSYDAPGGYQHGLASDAYEPGGMASPHAGMASPSERILDYVLGREPGQGRPVRTGDSIQAPDGGKALVTRTEGDVVYARTDDGGEMSVPRERARMVMRGGVFTPQGGFASPGELKWRYDAPYGAWRSDDGRWTVAKAGSVWKVWQDDQKVTYGETGGSFITQRGGDKTWRTKADAIKWVEAQPAQGMASPGENDAAAARRRFEGAGIGTSDRRIQPNPDGGWRLLSASGSVVVAQQTAEGDVTDADGRWRPQQGQASPSERASVTVGARQLEGDPIDVGDDIQRAAQLLAEGKRVNLDQPRSVSTLLGELASWLQRAEAGEIDEPTFDLCKVSVQNTNLFCVQTKGVERAKMPQLKGTPLPGSRADRELGKSKKGKVDLADLFRKHLEEQGHEISDDTVPASHLRASQRELDARKVIGKKEELLGGKKGLKKAAGKKPIKDLDAIFVSHDDYIVDGHHRWATAVAIDVGDNKLDDVDMDVMRVDMDIIELLDEANRFADEWGITPGGIGPESGQASPGEWVPDVDERVRAGMASPALTTFEKPPPTRHSVSLGAARDAVVARVDGEVAGFLTYYRRIDDRGRLLDDESTQSGDEHIAIDKIDVEPAYRRKGIASQMMRDLEGANSDALIDHGYRLPDGHAWAEGYYGVPTDESRITRNGKSVPAGEAERLRTRWHGMASPGEWAEPETIYGSEGAPAVEAWREALEPVEVRAVENYTAVANPTGGVRLPGSPTWEDLQRAATKGHVEQPTVVYRGIAEGYGGAGGPETKLFNEMGEGDEWTSGAKLISTSTDVDIARMDFGENLAASDEDVVLLRIELPEGAPAAFPSVTIEDMARQKEVLLPSGYGFVITDTFDEPRKLDTAISDRKTKVRHVVMHAVTYPTEGGMASPPEGVIGKRLTLKPEAGGQPKRLTKAQIQARAKDVVKGVVDFYGGEMPDVSFEPEYLADSGTDARFRHGDLLSGVLYGQRIADRFGDPEYGVGDMRIVAHEAAHSLSGVQPGPNPGFSQTFEEGGAEVLSIWFWHQRGQSFDERDAVMRPGEGFTAPGAPSLAASVAYREWTAETMRRAASKVGWEREALVGEIERVLRGDHGVRLAFRNETDPDFAPPEGREADAESLMGWLIGDAPAGAVGGMASPPELPLNRKATLREIRAAHEGGTLMAWKSPVGFVPVRVTALDKKRMSRVTPGVPVEDGVEVEVARSLRSYDKGTRHIVPRGEVRPVTEGGMASPGEIEPGTVVWAPVLGGEYRVRVVDVEGDKLVVKLPGSDAGTTTVDARRVFPSGQQPSSTDDVWREQGMASPAEHGTSVAAAKAILSDGFSMEHAAPDGEFGPGFYFVGGKLVGLGFTDMHGETTIHADVNLKNPATPDEVNAIRQEVRDEIGDDWTSDPDAFKRRFLKAMRERGHDGAQSPDGGVIAVYDATTISDVKVDGGMASPGEHPRGEPTWPNWRKAKSGTRVRAHRTGATGTFVKPSRIRNNGAVVDWDDVGFGVSRDNVISPAVDLEVIEPTDGMASPPEFKQGSFLAKMQQTYLDKLKGKPARTPELERSEMEAPPAPVQGIPDYSDVKLKDLKAAGGSNGARLQEDADGRQWLVKTYRGDKDRVATELLANSVYRELGVTVPNAGYTEVKAPKHGPSKALTYPLVDGELRRWKGPDDTLAEGFVADALLANWDVVGLGQDNVLWNDGTPVRLDQGGTLEFRAMGSRKPFGPVPSEMWSMNKPGGQAYGRMAITDEGLRAAAADVDLRLTPERIDALTDAAPFEDDDMRGRVREALKERTAWLGRFSRGEENLPEPLAGEEVLPSFEVRDADLETFPEEDAALEHYLEHQAEVDNHLRSGAPKEKATFETQGTVKQLDTLLGDKVTRVDEDFIAWIVLPDAQTLDEGAEKLWGKALRERAFMNAQVQFSPTPGTASIRVLVSEGQNALMPSVLSGLHDPTPGRVILRRGSRIRLGELKDLDGAKVIEAILE